MAGPYDELLAGPVQMHTSRSHWRLLTQDEEIPALIAQFSQAQADAVRARSSLAGLVARCRLVAEEIARTYVTRETDIADIVQDALLLLSRDPPHLRTASAFPAWFATVVHNVCRRRLRREHSRQGELSLDAPPRSGWLESDAPPPLDVPDPDAARAFLHYETGEQLQRLLQTLPAQQRAALLLAYIEDLSHEQIGRQLGVSPRAAEGLVYRALRRLQTVAAQCRDEPEELTAWCPLFGQKRLIYQILPGVHPEGPLWHRWRCPGCGLGSAWTEPNVRRLSRYPALETAWWQDPTGLAADARQLARGRGRRCWKCGEPLFRRDRPADDASASGGTPHYILHWSCFHCDVGTFYGHYFAVAPGLSPEWLAFWRSAPRLLLEPERLVKTAGEEHIVLTARDPDSGRRATLAVARATLEVRRFAVEGG
ncbi:MAG: RNA polymerase sigma factor [Chloroflexota bacterium]